MYYEKGMGRKVTFTDEFEQVIYNIYNQLEGWPIIGDITFYTR